MSLSHGNESAIKLVQSPQCYIFIINACPQANGHEWKMDLLLYLSLESPYCNTEKAEHIG